MNDQATQPAFMRRDNPAFIVAADNMAELEQAAQGQIPRSKEQGLMLPDETFNANLRAHP